VRPETRTARALAQWARSNYSDQILQAAVTEQIAEALYWERAWLTKRMNKIVSEFEGELPAPALSVLESVIGLVKQELIIKQRKDDLRDRFIPDWRARNGWSIAIPPLNRPSRPWPPSDDEMEPR
jgi:hypothetical protein